MKRAVAMLALLAACQAAPAGPRPPAPPKVFVAESPPPVVVSPRARRAAALFEEARRLEDAGIVDVAAEGYRAAYALDPRPATLAAHARALVALGDRDAAGSLFADGDHGVDAATLAAVRSAPSAPPGQRLDQALQAAGGAAPLALARARYWHRRHGGTFAVDLRHARRLGERAPSPLGQSLGLPAAFAGADVVYLEADTGVSVFDVAAGRVTRFITVPEALGVAADDAHVAVGLPGRVAVLELASGERVATLWGEPTAYANVALGRDHVAAASRDGSIAVWRRDSGALVWQHALERHWSMEVIQLRIVDSDLVVSFRGAHRLLALADGAPRKLGRACRNGRLVAIAADGFAVQTDDPATLAPGAIVHCARSTAYRGVEVARPGVQLDALAPTLASGVGSHGALDLASGT